MFSLFLKWPNYDILMAYTFLTVRPFLENIFAVANRDFSARQTNKTLYLKSIQQIGAKFKKLFTGF
jgi:hypothetical protein